jgi:NAD kinase
MYEKIVLVIRKTRLDGLVERYNTRSQAKFYIEHSGGDFDFYLREHEAYYRSLDKLHADLQNLSKLQVIERMYLPSFLFTDNDLVVTIGIDGLVVNTAKYLDHQPLLAVNPDPERIDGVLIPFSVDTALPAVENALQGEARIRPVTMAEATLNTGETLLAFNDLFIGVQNHVSARYRIQFGRQSEAHSSSGVIVSTGAGATGWLSSFFNMAEGMLAAFSDRPEGLSPPQLTWDTDQLVFVVREPFVSKTSSAAIVCGRLTRDQPLILESHTSSGGVIFSDGVLDDFLAFDAGIKATIGIADKKTNLVMG